MTWLVLTLKFLAMWTVVSIALGLIIGPLLARNSCEHETESQQDWFARHKFRRWS